MSKEQSSAGRGQSEIRVEGAREHNLKGIDVSIPRDTFTVVTGVSGSGKSSLAFDTICREGQRRFLESLSAYARQFLGGFEKPRVDRVEGLSPTVSIDQKTVARNPRSTVGTVTEIYDHLRLLFARLGTPHCPVSGEPVRAETADGITDRLLRTAEGKRVVVMAPIVRDRKGAYRKELEDLRKDGYVRARIDGEIKRLDDVERLDRYKRHTIEVVLDRLKPSAQKRVRVTEAIEAAARLGEGTVVALIEDEPVSFSTLRRFAESDVPVPDMEPRLFSFNAPQGACGRCSGLGRVHGVDVSLLVPDPTKSIADGALSITTPNNYLTYCGLSMEGLSKILKANKIDPEKPWKALSPQAKRKVLYGTGAREYDVAREWDGANFSFRREETRPFEGVIPAIENTYRENGSRNIERRYLADVRCPDCEGTRLGAVARAVKFREWSITALTALSISELASYFRGIELDERESLIGRDLFPELAARFGFLEQVGLGYLTLDRGAATLSGGESQRIHLATQLGAGLRGVLYVLDEPSIGLHPRDNARLLAALAGLRDLGNTVIVVEHDEETMRAADHLVDIGPGPGQFGGEVVAEGTIADIERASASITGQFLRGKLEIPVPETRRPVDAAHALTVRGAAEHNLKEIDVTFPLGCFTAVTGVSGSGKSTLVNRILKRALARKFHNASAAPGRHAGIDGIDLLDKVVEIDQKPLGRSPRSNPATYTKLYDEIRKLLAQTEESRVRGYAASRFSFNVAGGRCEACKGAGVVTIEMQFLADVQVECEVCCGRRFNRETLEVTWNGLAADEILELTVDEAFEFFKDLPRVRKTIEALRDVGLGYVALGQPTTTISGGEAQRIKLAAELKRPATGRTLYLLDEPTTGLHLAEVTKLLHALQRLVDAGNAVVVIEHNLEVIKVADHVIDLGPDGGDGGGRLVVAGTPEAVGKAKASYTGRALRPVLAGMHMKPGGATKRPARKKAAMLQVRGARQHNLKGVDVDIPVGKLTVVTGVSGSGKTSLAFDTIFAEGQRRFVESLSTYARRFLGRLEKAPVDRLDGLGPAIAIDQRASARSPRSTVATATEIHDYLRLLYARLGRLHCPQTGVPLIEWSATTLAAHVVKSLDAEKIHVLAPLYLPTMQDVHRNDARYRKGLAQDLQRAGFLRMVVGDSPTRAHVVDLRKAEVPKWGEEEPAFVVVDRTAVSKERRGRLAEAFETAFRVGQGRAGVWIEGRMTDLFATFPANLALGLSFTDRLSPRHFSFNSHVGACATCDGLGTTVGADLKKVLADPARPLFDGALHETVDKILNREGGIWRSVLRTAAEDAGGDLARPFGKLSKRVRDVVLVGNDGKKVRVKHEWSGEKKSALEWNTAWRGLLPALERWARKNEEGQQRELGYEAVLSRGPCPDCGGERLRPISRAVRVGSKRSEKRLPEVLALSVRDAATWFQKFRATKNEAPIAEPIIREITHRLDFLVNVGLDYLTLDRGAATLSGGEAQRIRLATQIGNRLTGVNYVLDEPTIGLHPRDTDRLTKTLFDLRDLGNTVLVVEHDEALIEAADHVVELGPAAGRNGGEIVAVGTPAKIRRGTSPTGRWLKRRKQTRSRPRRSGDGMIQLRGATRHNLKNVGVDIPRGALTVVTGVSGSGKSTLVMDVLAEEWSTYRGAARLKRAVIVDAAPIGATPTSNPATYANAFTPIRELYAELPEARTRGFKPARFSFNVTGGRCDTCGGRGQQRVEMHFLSDVWVQCEECRGHRYNAPTLGVKFKGRSIADVLETEVAEALELFRDIPKIRRPLELLDRVGLGYLTLGQPANTLSGGEAQRVKLAAELSRKNPGDSLYLLDEPTIGLHGTEVAKLLGVLDDLIERGATVVVIEHQVDVMCAADHLIDLGPEGGDKGGEVVVEGTPEAVAACRGSATGRVLREWL